MDAIMEKQKTKVIVIKRQKTWGGKSFPNEEKEVCESDIRIKTDLDQVHAENLLPFWEAMGEKL